MIVVINQSSYSSARTLSLSLSLSLSFSVNQLSELFTLVYSVHSLSPYVLKYSQIFCFYKSICKRNVYVEYAP